ncbi:MAG: SDR family oxidoreductase [Thermonemataceae bacterium]
MKNIFITGGAQGIGAAITRHFQAQGWQVGIFDVDKEKIAQIEEDLPNVYGYVGDVTQPEDLQKALEAFTALKQATLNVLCNNAGIVTVGEFEEVPLEKHHQIVDVNLKGVINTTHAALPFLKRASEAVIVNLSSASALYGHPEITAYAATKAAVRSLTEAWYLAFRRYNIHATDLLPIFVKTRMVNDHYHQYSKLDPDKVTLTPEHVARVVWKAVHQKKVHHLVGKETRLYAQLLRWLPAVAVPNIVRKAMGYEK